MLLESCTILGFAGEEHPKFVTHIYIQFPKMNVSPLLSYEAKLLFSEGCGRMQTCSHTLDLLQDYYHTSGLSKEVYNFFLPQGAQKLPAKVQMKVLIY